MAQINSCPMFDPTGLPDNYCIHVPATAEWAYQLRYNKNPDYVLCHIPEGMVWVDIDKVSLTDGVVQTQQ